MQCALETWISYGKPSVCGLFSGQAAKMVTLLTLPVALGASHLEFAVPADTGLRTLKRRLLRSLLKASLSHHLLLELHSLHSIPLAGGLGRGGHSSNSSLRLSSLGLGLLQRLNLQSLLCTCHALHSKRKAAGTTKDPA